MEEENTNATDVAEETPAEDLPNDEVDGENKTPDETAE